MRAAALTRLLSSIGARPVGGGETPDYLFCAGDGEPALTLGDLGDPASPSGGVRHSLLVVDATPDKSAIGTEIARRASVRQGIWATDAPGVFVVRPGGAAGRHSDLGPADARIQ